MWEYFTYVFLVFIPIASVMFYILKKNNLSLPNIWTIIVLSFIIIITFPVSVTKIGTLAAITLYCIILAGLSLYLLRSDTDYSLEAEPGDKNVLDISFNSMQELGPDEIIVLADIAYMNNNQTVQGMAQADGYNEGEEKVEAKKSAETHNTDKFKENVKISLDEQKASSEENIAEGMVEENKEIQLLPVQETDFGKEESFDEIAGYILDAGEKEQAMFLEDDIEDMAETGQDIETAEVQQENNNRIKEETHAGEVYNNAKDDEIINILDKGFAAKIASDFKSAFEYFYAAWFSTSDLELKYMLTAELAELSKILGWYSQGEEILVKFIDEAFLNDAMKNEAERMLMSIRLIEQEIRRLNLNEVPFSKLPRLVKVKVEEEMRRLYI